MGYIAGVRENPLCYAVGIAPILHPIVGLCGLSRALLAGKSAPEHFVSSRLKGHSDLMRVLLHAILVRFMT